MTQQIEREALQESNEWRTTLDNVKALEVSDAESFKLASDFVKLAKDNLKRLDARRTDITKPMLAAKRKVDELFSPALSALKEIEANLKAKIGVYHALQAQAQVLAMTESAENFAAGLVPSNSIPEVPTEKGVSVKVRWEWEVTNPDLVPRDLCSPDDQKIYERIRYHDSPNRPPDPVPGLTFHLRTSVAVRS